MSKKIISDSINCNVETFYSKSIKKHFKYFKINNNHSYVTDLMNKDIIFIEKYKIEVNHRQLYYKSFILNGVNYEIEKEIDFLNSNMTLYIDYGMSMKNFIKNYYTTKEGLKIYISLNNIKSYEKINSYAIEDKNNISEQVCMYLNEHKKDIEKLTEEDFELIKILNY